MSINSNKNGVTLMDDSGNSVQYARIQMRRGLESQFDASKMLPAEFAVLTDTKKLYISFSSGEVKRISTFEDMSNDLANAIADIEKEYLGEISEAISNAQSATSSATSAAKSANAATSNANAAADEARQTVWNNKNITNSTSAAESQVETAAGAAVLTGVDGKTEQVTTTGAQLIDTRSKVSVNSSECLLTFSGNGEIIINGTARNSNPDIYFFGSYGISEPILAEGNVTLKIEGATEDETSYLLKETEFMSSKGDKSVTYNNVTAAMIRLKPGKVYSNFKIKPMVNFGSEPLPWEPYTGGIPGPNPDYQIKIQGVGGNTSDDSFGFKAVVQGYQLLDVRKGVGNNFTGCTLSFDGNGGIIIDGTPSASNPDIYLIGAYGSDTEIFSMDKYCFKVYGATSDERLIIINITAVVGESDGARVATCNDRVTCLIIRLKTGKKYDKFKIYPMFNKGDSPFDWEPYHRSELPVTLTHPLFEGDKLMQVKSGQTYVDADGATQTADRDMWGCQFKNRIIQSYSSEDVGDNWKSTTGELTQGATVVYESAEYFVPFTDQSPFFAWTTPTGGCTITTDDPLEPIISADTAQTPEGSYLLTGYVEGLRARTLEQRILELEKKAIKEV